MMQGAEAVISFRKDSVVKERPAKGYRHPDLDEEIRRQRNKREASILKKLHEKGIAVPKVISVSPYEIEMQKLDGKTASEAMSEKIAREMGDLIGKIHSLDIIHGDLTPANFVVAEKLYAIDFGLSFHSLRTEDKATDMHVLEEALEAKYPLKWKALWGAVLEGYSNAVGETAFSEVEKRLEKISKRGRYNAK